MLTQRTFQSWGAAGKHTLAETISDVLAASPSSTAGEKLTAIFMSLAQHIGEDTNLRAGMKLTLEPTINNSAAFAHWVDAISDIIDTAITEGEFTDTSTTHRLAWNLCAGTIGAANASATLREDVDFATRIEDTVTAHTKAATHLDRESTARRQREGRHPE
ncbi:hypothetical protein ACU5JM_22520 [Rhodococcus erythropolis]